MYSKILIPTDGSDLSEKAIAHGVTFAAEIGASVVFLTVTEMWSAADMVGHIEQGEQNPVALFEKAAKEHADAILSKAREVADSKSVDAETVHLPDGVPAEGIISVADKTGCDLILMASHGRRGFDRILVGSQTAEVVALSKIPVLVVR